MISSRWMLRWRPDGIPFGEQSLMILALITFTRGCGSLDTTGPRTRNLLISLLQDKISGYVLRRWSTVQAGRLLRMPPTWWRKRSISMVLFRNVLLYYTFHHLSLKRMSNYLKSIILLFCNFLLLWDFFILTYLGLTK